MRFLATVVGRFGFGMLILCFALVTLAHGQTQKKPLTLEWLFGSEGRGVASLPPTAWPDDGTLIILDEGRPASERTAVHTALGNRDEAFALLEKGYQVHDWFLSMLSRAVDEKEDGVDLAKVDPLLDNLRSDPRYAAILGRMRLPL